MNHRGDVTPAPPTIVQATSAQSHPSQVAGGNPSANVTTEARERVIIQDGVEARERLIVESQVSAQSLEQILHLELMNDEMRNQAYQALQYQRARFEHEANEYMTEARDVTSAEVAQARAVVQSNYNSALQYVQRAAESAMGHQRTSLIQEAEEAMSHQRSKIVEEAETYVQRQQQNIADVATRKERAIEHRLDEAEGNLSIQTKAAHDWEAAHEKLREELSSSSGLRSQLREANAQIKNLEAEMAQMHIEKKPRKRELSSRQRIGIP